MGYQRRNKLFSFRQAHRRWDNIIEWDGHLEPKRKKWETNIKGTIGSPHRKYSQYTTKAREDISSSFFQSERKQLILIPGKTEDIYCEKSNRLTLRWNYVFDR